MLLSNRDRLSTWAGTLTAIAVGLADVEAVEAMHHDSRAPGGDEEAALSFLQQQATHLDDARHAANALALNLRDLAS